MVSFHDLLAKVAHYDHDERWMAISDLTNELSKEMRLDYNQEKQLCSAILTRLEVDTNNDVQAMSVKCLSVLVRRVAEPLVIEISSRLCQHILSGRAEMRDVYGIGMKTLIAEALPAHGPAITEHTCRALLTGVDSADAGVRSECLDILSDLLKRFGAAAENNHKPLAEAALRHLADALPFVRKRANAALAALTPALSDALLDLVVGALLGSIEAATAASSLTPPHPSAVAIGGAAQGVGSKRGRGTGHGADTTVDSGGAVLVADASAGAVTGTALGVLVRADTRTLTQALGSVSRHVGGRLGRFLPRVIPILLSTLGDATSAATTHGSGSGALGDDTFGSGAAGAELVELTDVREIVLQALESFVLRCPRDVAPFRTSITAAALAFAAYDPNLAYVADDDADDDVMAVSNSTGACMDDDGHDLADGDSGDNEEEIEDDAEDGFGDDYGDEDDSSWKVRRAALRVLGGLAAAAATDISSAEIAVAELSPPLVRRLRVERDETVRLEAAGALGDLVRAAAAATAAAAVIAGEGSTHDAEALQTSLGVAALAVPAAGAVTTLAVEAANTTLASDFGTVTSPLAALVPSVIPAALRQLKSHVARQLKTRTASLSLILRLIGALGTCGGPARVAAGRASLSPYVPALLAALYAGASERAGPTAASHRLEALGALHTLLLVVPCQEAVEAAAAAAVAGHGGSATSSPVAIAALSSAISRSINEDDWFRNVAQALRCAAVIATLLRPRVPGASGGGVLSTQPPALSAADAARAAAKLYDAVLPRLSAHDIDVEIKEAALVTAGALLAHAADVLPDGAVTSLLAVLPARLRSDNTRLPALRALSYAAASPLCFATGSSTAAAFSAAIPALVPEMCAFLRQASRPLRLQALAALVALVTAFGAALTADVLRGILSEAAASIGDSDLALSHAALALATAALQYTPAAALAGHTVAETILPRAVPLTASPLLTQGAGLKVLSDFFIAALHRGSGSGSGSDGDIVPALSLPALLDAVTSATAVRLTAAAPRSAPRSGASAASAGASAASAVTAADDATAAGAAKDATITSSRVVAALLAAAAAPAAVASVAVAPIVATLVEQGLGPAAPAAAPASSAAHLLQGLALRCLGEAGRNTNIARLITESTVAALVALLGSNKRIDSSGALGASKAVAAPSPNALNSSVAPITFMSSEAVRSSVTFALGGIMIGAPTTVLPIITARLRTYASTSASDPPHSSALMSVDDGEVYLLLSSLREALLPPQELEQPSNSSGVYGSAPHPVRGSSFSHDAVEPLLALLCTARFAGASDEGLRMAAAEVIGRLAAVAPETGLQAMAALASAAASASAAPSSGVTPSASTASVDADAPESPTAEGALRWTATTALRFLVMSSSTHRSLAAPPPPGTAAPASVIARGVVDKQGGLVHEESFLGLLLCALDDGELAVRAAALSTLNAIAHTAPELLAPLLRPVAIGRFNPKPTPVAATVAGASLPQPTPAVAQTSTAPVGSPGTASLPPRPCFTVEGALASLYYECLPRPSLVYEVDLGPFKHVQDDGLPLRRAAFATLDSLLAAVSVARGGVSLAAGITLTVPFGPELLPLLASGARDHDDVRALANGAIVRATHLPQLASAFASADGGLRIADALADIFNRFEAVYAKGSGIGDFPVDVVRSAVRALHAILRAAPSLPVSHRRLASYLSFIESHEPLRSVIVQVRSS